MFAPSFNKSDYVKNRLWKSYDYLPNDKNLTEVESTFKKQIHLDNYSKIKLKRLFSECVLNIANIQIEIHNNLLKYKREQFIQTILTKNINRVLERLLNKLSQLLFIKPPSDLNIALKNIFIKLKFGAHQKLRFKRLFINNEIKNYSCIKSLRHETIDSIWICCLFKSILEVFIETEYGKQIVLDEVRAIILSPDDDVKDVEYELVTNDLFINEEAENLENKDDAEFYEKSKHVYKHKEYVYFAGHQQFEPVLELSYSLDEIILGISLPNKPSVECAPNILGLEVFALDGVICTVDLKHWSRLYVGVNKDTEFPLVICLREFPKLIKLHFLVRFVLEDGGKKMEGPLSNTVSCTLK